MIGRTVARASAEEHMANCAGLENLANDLVAYGGPARINRPVNRATRRPLATRNRAANNGAKIFPFDLFMTFAGLQGVSAR